MKSNNLFCTFLIVVFFIVGCASPPALEEPLQILFIGNSYTFVNQMPETFATLAELGGHEVMVTSLAKGGYSLANHAQDNSTRSALESQRWDYVILQEKSDFPISQVDRESQMYPSIRLLNELAAAQGAETILFMPWAYRDGFPEFGLSDYLAMQAEVANAYIEIADELGLRVAPVGLAWQSVLQHEPQLGLWGPDSSHPSPLGSYLAANVFYALIFNESLSGLLYTPQGVNERAGKVVVEIASQSVLGD